MLHFAEASNPYQWPPFDLCTIKAYVSTLAEISLLSSMPLSSLLDTSKFQTHLKFNMRRTELSVLCVCYPTLYNRLYQFYLRK